MQFLGSNIRKFQETETPKKNPYTSGNGNPRKASYISGNGTLPFSPQAQRIKESTPRKFLILQETEAPKNFLYFLKRKLFLYFRKRKRRRKVHSEEPWHI